MRHLPLLLLALSLPAVAQPANMDPPERISGQVLNTVTGAPIPGAVVHYRGEARLESNNSIIDPTTLQGNVTTGPDGRYATPPLPAFGYFQIHASAPGFFAASVSLQALPDRVRRMAPPVIPGHLAPILPDGNLRLQPDEVNLRVMSDAALSQFAPPHGSFDPQRGFFASRFTDANHFEFQTWDYSVDEKQIGTVRCRAWAYDLSTGSLSGSDLRSPLIISGGKSAYGFCQPDEVRSIQTTTDGRFTVGEKDDLDLDTDDEYKGCTALVAMATAGKKVETVAQHCFDFSFLVDAARNLVFYTQPAQTRSESDSKIANIVEFNLDNRTRRSFPVPVVGDGPGLIAEHSLGGGATVIAYSMHGDCDRNTSDYSQPDQPGDSALGETPNQFSVCFITIPPDSPLSRRNVPMKHTLPRQSNKPSRSTKGER